MTLNTLMPPAHLEEFLAGTQPVVFSVLSPKEECYRWLQTSLLPFEYLALSRPLRVQVCVRITETSLEGGVPTQETVGWINDHELRR
jgi:hypothetical protein